MTSKLTITDERLGELVAFKPLPGTDINSATRDEWMAMAAELQERRKADSEPVAWLWSRDDERDVSLTPPDDDDDAADAIECGWTATPLYRHAQQPVVPDEKPMPNPLSMYAVDAVAAIAEVKGWNTCRAAMLQGAENAEPRCGIQTTPALDSFKKNADVRCGNSPANDTNVVKRLAITLPDTSSKAFWSGTGKTETFHPVTYRRWVKEAIERYCAIARIDVEVK